VLAGDSILLEYDTASSWGNQIQKFGRSVSCTELIFYNQQVLDKAFFQDLLIMEDEGNIFLQNAEISIIL
jgi:hypothetical protein